MTGYSIMRNNLRFNRFNEGKKQISPLRGCAASVEMTIVE
jgi:hypothetical protein